MTLTPVLGCRAYLAAALGWALIDGSYHGVDIIVLLTTDNLSSFVGVQSAILGALRSAERLWRVHCAPRGP